MKQLGAVDVHSFDDRPGGGTAVLRFGVRDLGLLRRVARLEGVRWIEPVLEMADDSPGTPPQPAIASFGPIWDQGVHGEGQVIGVMDAGPFDMEHCFFEDPAVDEPGRSHRKVIALRNKVGNRPDPTRPLSRPARLAMSPQRRGPTLAAEAHGRPSSSGATGAIIRTESTLPRSSMPPLPPAPPSTATAGTSSPGRK